MKKPNNSLSSQPFLEKFSQAVDRRRSLALPCCRLFDGSGDGVAGVTVDKFENLLVIHTHRDAEIPPEVLSIAGAKSAVKWAHERGARQGGNSARWIGPSVERLVVEESGLHFLLRPERNHNAGLFLDTRELRGKVREKSPGTRVLNLFCYTGSIGLAALSGGALEVVQVDVSKSMLSWARENLDLNPGGKGSMRFIPEDVKSFLEKESRRQARNKEEYDFIFLDPPTFGVAGKRSFKLESDLGGLIELALPLVRKGGGLSITCNSRDARAEWIRAQIVGAADAAGVNLRNLSPLLPPSEDFTAPISDSNSMRGFWVEL